MQWWHVVGRLIVVDCRFGSLYPWIYTSSLCPVCVQGWKYDGFQKYLGDKAKAAEHTEIFTRIQMDLLNAQLLRCAAVLFGK